ncbi:MAG: flagellar filament capping protein FliD [Gammaproteobacteria bacterium]|nr:flagellar filament capping protein FliD [Gammaproteobacteria bacterium]
MIVAPGIGSGLDVNSIVSQLMDIERRPLTVLGNRETQFEAQLSAIGRLKGVVSSFQTAMSELANVSKFNIFAAQSSNEEVLTASASTSAASGTFDIEVVRLAERHKMGSDAFADVDTVVTNKTRTATIQMGSDSNNAFTVDLEDQTLAQVRDAINSDPDNPGVSASIINDDSGARLLLSADETGTANEITFTVQNEKGKSAADPLKMTTINAVQDARILVDGFTVTRSSNVIDDVIEGVTLELHQTDADPVTLTLEHDIDAIVESVEGFVNSFNELRSTLEDLRSSDLASDNTLLVIESRLLSVLGSPVSGASVNFSYLAEVGVSLQKDGNLALDRERVESTLNTDFRGFAQLFADSEQGFAVRLDALAQGFLDSNGIIDAREDGLNERLEDIDDSRATIERRLESTEERIRAQFAALDSLLGRMQQTSDFLTQQLIGLTPQG